MRIIFCNTAYLKYYDGRIAGEMKPTTGGRWVQEHGDAHEKWNFLNVDGYCYGYVQGREQMHIERIDKKFNKQEKGEDVTVVWCAIHPESGETVIVGWYEHATVFRYLQYDRVTPVTGLDRAFWFWTEAENAYLLPEEERTMIVGRASEIGTGRGFGQMNYWYADNDYAKEVIIPSVMEYIQAHRDCRINALNDAFDAPKNLTSLTKEELDILNDVSGIGDFEYLQLSYRGYNQEKTGDNAYRIAATLSGFCQYVKAIQWYEKAIELNPEDWEAKYMLVYHYQHCERYEDAIKMAKELLDCEQANDPGFRDEVYCMLADEYYFLGNIPEATKWQDLILAESKNKDLLQHTRKIKAEWLDLLQ